MSDPLALGIITIVIIVCAMIYHYLLIKTEGELWDRIINIVYSVIDENDRGENDE